MVNEVINWMYISEIINYFSNSLKYTYVDTPWIVSNNIKNLTFTGHDIFGFATMNRSLVGSAEQGFIKMVLDDELVTEKPYISCGPCFRNEDEYDNLHRKYFMKAELFKLYTDAVNYEILKGELQLFVSHATSGFNFLLDKYNISGTVVHIETEQGFDINLNGIEIGSYGIRPINKKGINLNYIYGTAIAEPRFSESLKIKDYINGQ